ncbi:MAG: DUF177 domain-containing protein [Muribaculaceae bacterium]|nr:DUF177 domain-containing protein [Muribaculaceae bacterium]MDE6791823.1 DUF177 domain-containing protein [Muribaculaceae bacterium]
MGKFSQYKVQLASLGEGRHEQEFECGSEFFKNMENPDVLSADVKVHLDLIKKNDAYDCTFTCKGMLQVPCDRCLDPLDHEVDTTYHLTVKYGEDYNDDTDDVLIIPESSSFLNVAYMLYDTIVLTIPLRHVHPLGKCNRAMAAALHKHHGVGADEEVADAMDEVDSEISAGIDSDE